MRTSTEYTILDAAAAVSTGRVMSVQDFKTIVLSFAAVPASSLTVKIQGSIQEVAPDFAAAQSTTNHWDYIEAVDLQSGASVAGDTGVAVAAAEDYRLLEANVNGLKWVTVSVTARTAGSATVKGKLFSDD